MTFCDAGPTGGAFTGSRETPAGESQASPGGDDLVRGNGGADNLKGNAGPDIIDGGTGTDTANGGLGANACISIEFPTNC